MTKRRGSTWTEAELATIRANWNKRPVGQIVALLPRRTFSAVSYRASLLGLGPNAASKKYKKLGAGDAKEPAEPTRDEHPQTPLAAEVPSRMRRLAEFDPVIRRAMLDRLAGRSHPTGDIGRVYQSSALRGPTLQKKRQHAALMHGVFVRG